MPTHYVEDYEELTGLKRDKPGAEAKVITAADDSAPAVKKTAKAETK